MAYFCYSLGIDLCGIVSCFKILLLTHMMILSILIEQVNTERAIRHAIQERLPIVVVLNKVLL